MKLFEEFESDMDLFNPRVCASGKSVTIENVKEIKLVTDRVMTVGNGSSYVTVEGEGFVVKELCERRLVIEGWIRCVEFLRRDDKGQAGRV